MRASSKWAPYAACCCCWPQPHPPKTASCPGRIQQRSILVRTDEERTVCRAKGQGTINDARSEPFRLIRAARFALCFYTDITTPANPPWRCEQSKCGLVQSFDITSLSSIVSQRCARAATTASIPSHNVGDDLSSNGVFQGAVGWDTPARGLAFIACRRQGYR